MSTLTIPTEGWRLETISVRPERDGTCQLCGRRKIGRIHIMFHERNERVLLAGHRCAKRLREGHPPPRRSILASIASVLFS